MVEVILSSLLFLSILAGQVGRVELAGKLINIYTHEIVISIWIVYALVRDGVAGFRSIGTNKWILTFCIWTVLGFAFSLSEYSVIQNALSALYFCRLILYVIFGIVFLRWAKSSGGYTHCIRLLQYFSIGLICISLLQYVFIKDLWSLYPFGWDPHQFRIFASYLDVYVAAAIIGILSLFWLKKKNYFLAGALLVCLALTFSRSAYLAFIAAMVVESVLKKKARFGLLMILVFAVLVFVSPKSWGEGVNLLRTSTINSRLIDARLAIRIWEQSPVDGYGYNRIRYVKERLGLLRFDDRSHAASSFHSSYLIVLVSTGIVGLLLFIRAFIGLFSAPNLWTYGVFIGVMGLFDNVLLYGMVVLVTMAVISVSHPLRR